MELVVVLAVTWAVASVVLALALGRAVTLADRPRPAGVAAPVQVPRQRAGTRIGAGGRR